MRLSQIYKALAILAVILLALFLPTNYLNISSFPKSYTKIQSFQVDNCLNCHKNYGSLDENHPIEVFGCAMCHGGSANAKTKEEAHKQMVINPSYLQHAQIFCSNCHKDIVHRVSTSPMQTQIGIKKILDYQWIEKSTSNLSKSELEEISTSHFNKACASCHINQNEKLFKDKSSAKGGGCADCHRVAKIEGKHSKFSTKIPSSTCLKCHNRSNRIGLSYFGKFESEGYGTPYKKGKLTHKLDSSRYFYELPADTHHQKLGLECIDCHTHTGIMGDGVRHDFMQSAVDVSCLDCHNPNFKKADEMAEKLRVLNDKIPYSKEVAYTKKKNTSMYNLHKSNDKMILYRKLDGKAKEFSKMSQKPYHSLEIHKRLDCSSCHSKWMPSCYGCHEVYFDKGKQFDWTKSKMTKGSWQEFRSFLRYESPSLGIGNNKKIMPFAPGCQVIGTIFKNKKVEKFHAMAMAEWQPHTTSKSRECISCHFDPASLGLGRGNLDIKNSKINFTPFYDSNKSGQPFGYPIDAFVSKDGKSFQSTSRENSRSFNQQEIRKIVNAYKCIICHRDWNDKIYLDYKDSLKRFNEGKTPCEF